MNDIFLTILNMSITGSYVAIAVIIGRRLLRKAPKAFSYALWVAVWIRLVLPFSFNSPISPLQFLAPNVQSDTGALVYIPQDIGLMKQPSVNSGINSINTAVNASLPAPSATELNSINPLQVYIEVARLVWIAGIVLLSIYAIVSLIKVHRQTKTATRVRDNIFETDSISTPFVFGIFRPRIFLPTALSESEVSYILAHEQTHIRRRDYVLKPLAFTVLLLHWFNPLAWLSFALMSRDMEMSCDESVIGKLGEDIRGSYSNSLLSVSMKQSGLTAASPLGFGEGSIKSRITNVLNYKKPTHFAVIAACIFSLMIIVGFTSNPVSDHPIHPSSGEALTRAGAGPLPAYNELDKIATVNVTDTAAGANADISEKLRMATLWANALKTRDGKPRYEMMSPDMKQRFIQEQIDRAGPDWNFNIGVSSPWVVDFDVKISGMTADITYMTKTSTPEYYRTLEVITFGSINGKLHVVSQQTIYEDKLVKD